MNVSWFGILQSLVQYDLSPATATVDGGGDSMNDIQKR